MTDSKRIDEQQGEPEDIVGWKTMIVRFPVMRRHQHALEERGGFPEYAELDEVGGLGMIVALKNMRAAADADELVLSFAASANALIRRAVEAGPR